MSDTSSFSFISTNPDVETLYTPSFSEDRTDDWVSASVSRNGRGTDDDSLYPFSDVASHASTTVLLSAYRHEHHLGRRYHSFRSGNYPLPDDTVEQQLEELKHHLMVEVMKGNLFVSDIVEEPEKIIDIGTGAGTWAIDVADKYPHASVIGTDLSPIQPSWVPPNARMFVDDCENEQWAHGNEFDFAHMRSVLGFLQDPGRLLRKVYENLKMGGWVESQDWKAQIICRDGTMDKDDPVKTFIDLCVSGMLKLGCPHFGTPDYLQPMEEAGFTNLRLVEVSVPLGTWPEDEHQKYLGTIMKTAFCESLDGYAAKPFDAMEMPLEERKELVSQTKTSLDDTNIHRYLEICFSFGQKGPPMESEA